MTTKTIYDCTLADHSNDDTDALMWANGFGLSNIETSEQTISTAAWREVGLADGDTIRVWHDGCESYCFEALNTEPSDDDCLETALTRLGADDGCRDYVIFENDDAGGKSVRVKIERDDAIELGRRILAANAARDIDYESPDAVDPWSRWCGDTTMITLGETPADFESEITLTAGEIVVRMQYRDGGGMDCRGDYRYEITANGETWYDDGLQSPRGGFGHAADSEDAFREMACSMLSFATTDDPEAECRAPESMQDALENANCDVSEPEDGSDKPDGWTVVDPDDDDDSSVGESATAPSDCRIWVGCLASYNAGELFGEWIDVDGDADDLQTAVGKMLEASPAPNAEEWRIHDSEGFGPITIGEYETLERVAMLAEVIEEHDAILVDTATDHIGSDADAKNITDWIQEHYRGEFESVEDYARSYIDDTGMFADVPDTISNYFDYQSFGRDMELGGDIFTVRDGAALHIFDNH